MMPLVSHRNPTGRITMRSLDAALRLVGALSLPESREWIDALRGETWAAQGTWQRVRMATGGLAGLTAFAIMRTGRDCATHPQGPVASLLLGLGIAAVDAAAGSRTPLMLLLGAACLATGLLRPAGASLRGLMLGMGVPILAFLTDYAGPYGSDRGDVWFLVAPAILAALLGRSIRVLAGAR